MGLETQKQKPRLGWRGFDFSEEDFFIGILEDEIWGEFRASIMTYFAQNPE